MCNEEKLRLEGYLLDHNVHKMVIGMIRGMADGHDGDLASFLQLGKGGFLKLYELHNPGGRQVGNKTWNALDTAKQGLLVMKKTDAESEETCKVSLDAAIDQAKREIRAEFENQAMQTAVVMSVLTCLETLGYKDSFPLGKFLSLYDMAKGGAK